jgi:hypothetical protein
MTSLFDHIMNLAREAGADSPQLGEDSDGAPVVVDTNDGECYVIELRAMSGATTVGSGSTPGLDQTQALAEGWCVIDVNDGSFLEIQRSDEDSRFSTDNGADAHVRRRADEGRAYHKNVLRYVTAENRRRYEENRGLVGSIYMVLRSWDKEAVADRAIVRVRADYQHILGPYQEAVRQAVGSNQDLVDLDECAAIPDVTYDNDGLKFAAMQVHSDHHDYPIGCTCGACGHSFPIDPCTEENLKAVLVEGRRINVARCPQCTALAHQPKPRKS